MIPVFQDKFAADPKNLDPETTGNCFQACVASVLELPIDDVPHFVVEPGNWFSNFERWARRRGYWIAMVSGSEAIAAFAGYAIVNGLSPRDTQHSVVYNGEELAHDPNPVGGGLAKVESWYYFVPLDPAQAMRLQVEVSS